MSYRKVIEAIEGWERLSEQEVIDAATRLDHVYADPDKWTYLDLLRLSGRRTSSR